jgi:hypothetical protein
MNGGYMDEAFYDDADYYDLPVTPPKPMADIVRSIARLSAQDQSASIGVSMTALAAAPTTFTGAAGVLAAGATAKTNLDTKLARVDSLEADMATAREELRTARSEGANFYKRVLAAYVETLAQGDANIILLAGMQVVSEPGPAVEVTKVLNLTLTADEVEGCTMARWKAPAGARFFEVEVSVGNPNEPTTWVSQENTTAVSLKIAGKPSGIKLWCRVRAVNRISKGAWSDPACCTVP